MQSRLQGFYDPLPDFPKHLRIRYEFRGRMHYVEVGEFQFVVLPMEGTLSHSVIPLLSLT